MSDRTNFVVVIRQLDSHAPATSAVIKAEDWAQGKEFDSSIRNHLDELANAHIKWFKATYVEFKEATFIISHHFF